MKSKEENFWHAFLLNWKKYCWIIILFTFSIFKYNIFWINKLPYCSIIIKFVIEAIENKRLNFSSLFFNSYINFSIAITENLCKQIWIKLFLISKKISLFKGKSINEKYLFIISFENSFNIISNKFCDNNWLNKFIKFECL